MEFLKEIEDIVHIHVYCVSLGSLGDLEKAVETLTYWLMFPKHLSRSHYIR